MSASIDAKIKELKVLEDGRKLQITWADGKDSVFNSNWLRFNCQCVKCRCPVTQMKTFEISSIPLDDKMEVKIADCGKILVTWKNENHNGEFDPAFLRKNCYSKQSIEEKRQLIRALPNKKTTIEKMEWSELDNDFGLWRLLRTVNDDGIMMVKNVPTEVGTILKLMKRVGPTQESFYEETWHAVTKEGAINISETGGKLPYHLDIPMYEAPPGILFLECLEFDAGVDGGDTIFADFLQVAEQFRIDHPEHFKTLTTVPATIKRIHLDRDHPVHMIIRTPHIKVNNKGEILSFHWHPCHHGPLCVEEEYVDAYYHAYQEFHKAVENSPYNKKIRFTKGDMVVINNRRMVHCRTAYGGKPGQRHLQGGYVCIDDYKSRLNVLENTVGNKGPVRHVFNGDWFC
uniref:Gamma-butyrobetaine dioxygenase n=1 Tax=Pinctada fucata TaxID=50426 RepID=A0A194AQ79_PINFU